MPKLYSSVFVVRVLLRAGFVFVSQRGSHAKYRKGPRTAIVPMAKKEIPMGTFRSIVRQAGLSVDDFRKHK